MITYHRLPQCGVAGLHGGSSCVVRKFATQPLRWNVLVLVLILLLVMQTVGSFFAANPSLRATPLAGKP